MRSEEDGLRAKPVRVSSEVLSAGASVQTALFDSHPRRVLSNACSHRVFFDPSQDVRARGADIRLSALHDDRHTSWTRESVLKDALEGASCFLQVLCEGGLPTSFDAVQRKGIIIHALASPPRGSFVHVLRIEDFHSVDTFTLLS